MNHRRPAEIEHSAGDGLPLAAIMAVGWGVIWLLIALVMKAIESGVTPL